jgi:hypothetical protein
VVANDVLNRDAVNLPKAKQTNAKHTVVANDVQTASLGQIRDVVQLHMMDIVQPVSSKYFPTMNEAKSFTHTRRKSGFAMQSMMCLKDLFMINHYTQDTATVRIGDALIIGNWLVQRFFALMIHSGKWVFIRFNPDGKGVDMVDKLVRLMEEIQVQIDRIENDENNELLEIIKLYY